MVHQKLDYPENALGHAQPTSNFRAGDYRYSAIPKMINRVLYFNDPPYYRYLLDGIPNASYSEFELIPSKFKETKYKINKILDKKIAKITKILFNMVVWIFEQSTWEPEQQLIEDGLQD